MKILSTILAAAMLAGGLSGPVYAQSNQETQGAKTEVGQERPMLMYDVLFLNEGKTFADAQAYFTDVVPIVEGHGMKRLHAVEVVSFPSPRQDVKPAIVQVWQILVEDPFSAIFSDPAYLQHTDRRDEIFDFANGYAWIGPDYEVAD